MMWPDGRDNPSCICGVMPNVNCDIHVTKFPAPIEAEKELDKLRNEIADEICRTYETAIDGLDCAERILKITYQRLASEAVDIEIRIGVNLESGHFSKTTKVVPLSVIKELMGMAEK